MLQHVWSYVIAAYAIAGTGLVGLTIWTVVSLRRWAKRAREEEAK